MNATSVALDRSGAVATIRIAGDVTSGSEGELMSGFTGAVEGGARAIILDFSGLEYMNSGGIGLLVTVLVRAQRGGVRLLASGLSDHYREILALTRLDEAIEIHADEGAARAAVEV
jgi:anti-sigma B factor antagonist